MKVGILITARLSSTRLEKKHLLPINNRPILYYLIKRITQEFYKEIRDNEVQLIIATSDEQENRKFEVFLKDGASVFYGPLNNIPLRHLKAAEVFGLDAIVSVDGDDILCSPKGMREVYNALCNDIPYIKISNLPFGMNSWGYSYIFLAESVKEHIDDTLETGWDRIFDKRHLKEIKMPFFIKNDSLRFTLDYDDDYQFFKVLVMKFGEKINRASDEAIVNVVLTEEIYRLNESMSKQYWENYYRIQKQETIRSLNTNNKFENKEEL